jgi:REP element-mobilizing transposase RayT
MMKRLFIETDKYLDNNSNGPYWLLEDAVASIVANSLHYGHNKWYLLHCFSIMSNHVHVLLKHIDSAPLLSKILQMHKGFTGRECNKVLNRSGQFWEIESYDHVVRNSVEFERVKNYILNNSVKAGLVKHWEDWKWNYLAE